MKKIKFATGVATLLVSLSVLTGCGAAVKTTTTSTDAKDEKVMAVGSTALQPLAEQAAQEFGADHANITVSVQGGGSGTGLAQVQTGAVQIGNSDIFAEEKEGVDASELVDHKVAVVGMAPVVNADVKVDGLTQNQLVDIFTGKITNWKEVGGQDEAITIINRAAGSGTRATFEKWALGGATPITSQEQESSGTVVQIVGSTPGAISYLAFSQVTNDLKALAIDGVKPTNKNVESNDWKVWAYEHMYTKGEAKGATKEFIDYLLGSDAQKNIVEKMDFISIKDMKVERDAAGEVK
ncbi:MAG: phosphate ABC transporter substrate-binding protein PstS family protein [Lactobacillales bacterium]|jgi:phosphate transport system substrate-binding protein|nr:phosphate ABC transporter substrate-binding protein PstS family protein [Lactobacillales bacterium]